MALNENLNDCFTNLVGTAFISSLVHVQKFSGVITPMASANGWSLRLEMSKISQGALKICAVSIICKKFSQELKLALGFLTTSLQLIRFFSWYNVPCSAPEFTL